MPDLAPSLGIVSALILALAVGIWAGFLRGPLLQRLDGRRASNDRRGGIAIQLLIVALVFSAVAAVVAIVRLISP